MHIVTLGGDEEETVELDEDSNGQYRFENVASGGPRVAAAVVELQENAEAVTDFDLW